MTVRPNNLTDVHAVTWCALVAGLTLALCLLPAWVAHLAIVASLWGLVALSDDARRAKAARIRSALDICGYSLTTAARTANMDIADFSRMLTDPAKKLDDWRLEMLGDEFMRTLALLELKDRGLPEFARAAVMVEPFLKVSV
jgi:hypothetical protein